MAIFRNLLGYKTAGQLLINLDPATTRMTHIVYVGRVGERAIEDYVAR